MRHRRRDANPLQPRKPRGQLLVVAVHALLGGLVVLKTAFWASPAVLAMTEAWDCSGLAYWNRSSEQVGTCAHTRAHIRKRLDYKDSVASISPVSPARTKQ